MSFDKLNEKITIFYVRIMLFIHILLYHISEILDTMQIESADICRPEFQSIFNNWAALKCRGRFTKIVLSRYVYSEWKCILCHRNRILQNHLWIHTVSSIAWFIICCVCLGGSLTFIVGPNSQMVMLRLVSISFICRPEVSFPPQNNFDYITLITSDNC